MSFRLAANSQLIKNLNQQIVLNLIRQHQSISGADLAKITQLQPATISKILRTLSAMGLIHESGTGQSTRLGGKRPTLWRLKADCGYVIGIEVLPFELRGVLLDFTSTLIAQQTLTPAAPNRPENIAANIVQLVHALCQDAAVAMTNVIGMGLGISGLVDAEAGLVRYSIGLGMQDYPIRQELENRLGLRVLVDNDANAGAVASKWMGCGVNAQNLVYLTINESVTGIGCGIIIQGQLYRGVTSSAGELTLALPALRELNAGGQQQNETVTEEAVTMPSLIERARAGDYQARETLSRLGRIIAQEIARIIDFINPELVILGGDIAPAEDLILQPIRAEVERLTLALPFRAAQIRMTTLGRNAVSLGAASNVFMEIFKETKAAVHHEFNVPTVRNNRMKSGAAQI